MSLLSYISQINWHWPWLLLIQIPISIFLYFLFLSHSKHKSSAWGFLFEAQSNRSATSSSEKKLNWKPYSLANLCFIPLILFLAGPHLPQALNVICHDSYLIKHIPDSELKLYSQKLIRLAQDKKCHAIHLYYHNTARQLPITTPEDLSTELLSISQEFLEPSIVHHNFEASQIPYTIISGIDSNHSKDLSFLPYSTEPDLSGIESITLLQNKLLRIKINKHSSLQSKLNLSLNTKSLELKPLSPNSFYTEIPLAEAFGALDLQPYDQLNFNNTFNFDKVQLNQLKVNDPELILEGNLITFLQSFYIDPNAEFNEITISHQHNNFSSTTPTLFICTQKQKNTSTYAFKKFGINQSLFLNSSSSLAQSTRHQLFPWHLNQAPSHYIESPSGTPLLYRDNKAVLILLPNDKIITTLDINKCFTNQKDQEKLLALIISAFKLRDLDKPLILLQQKVHNTQASLKNPNLINQFSYGNQAFILFSLSLSSLLFILFRKIFN